MQTNTSYRGRFAPSPTGPLHFGSLVAAVGSYLQARHQNGVWFVRIEDLDPPREVPGASDAILRSLERFGFEWDAEVVFQSQRGETYLAALQQLRLDGLIYPCNCSRKEIAETGLSGRYGPIYSGLCRPGLARDRHPQALRIVTHNRPLGFDDALRGHFSQQIEGEVGDFVVRRADALFAYQLAVVVDDAAQQITEVVRGSDLLDNTPRQIHLQQLLALPTPRYVHLPVATNRAGEKLSKQTGATSIDTHAPLPQLMQALGFLGQQPPAELAEGDLDSFWHWAIKNWDLQLVPAKDQAAPSVQL